MTESEDAQIARLTKEIQRLQFRISQLEIELHRVEFLSPFLSPDILVAEGLPKPNKYRVK